MTVASTIYVFAVVIDTRKFFWSQALLGVLVTSVFFDRGSLLFLFFVLVVALDIYSFLASRWASQCQSLFSHLLF